MSFFLSLIMKDFWLTMMILSTLLGFFTLSMPFFSEKVFLMGMLMDKISLSLVYLSVWLSFLMFAGGVLFYYYNFYSENFTQLTLIMLTLFFFSFVVSSFVEFFIFFESSLIPIFFLVYGWGGNPERVEASWYIIFYTLFGSLPLLYLIIYMGNAIIVFEFYFFFIFLVPNYLLNFLFIFMLLAFLVKMPMYFVHLWLPKIHVEAPLSGSMILAGVLLKLGAYGIIRVGSLGCLAYKMIFVFSLFGGGLLGGVCLRQTDLKTLIAYSSVVHMSLIIGSAMVGLKLSLFGSIFMMISHGLCSSCLFYLANMTYERVGSRSILITKGMIKSMPLLSAWWFIFMSLNMSVPFSLGLFSELVLLVTIIKYSSYSLLMLFFISFLSSCYSVYMFSFSQHNENIIVGYLTQSKTLEYLIVFLHFLPLSLSLFYLTLLM